MKPAEQWQEELAGETSVQSIRAIQSDATGALASGNGCASCNAHEDRLEEIRMAVTLDQTAENPYGRTTIEYAVWCLRKTIEQLRKQNRSDRKQWKHELHEQRKLRRALENQLKHAKLSA